MLRLVLLHLLIASSDGLRPPPIARINRRQALARTVFGATVTPFLPVLAPPPAFAVEDDIQRVIPQKTLTSALATAPQRDIIITGSILHDLESTCAGKETYLSISYWHELETTLAYAQKEYLYGGGGGCSPLELGREAARGHAPGDGGQRPRRARRRRAQG